MGALLDAENSLYLLELWIAEQLSCPYFRRQTMPEIVFPYDRSDDGGFKPYTKEKLRFASLLRIISFEGAVRGTFSARASSGLQKDVVSFQP